MNKNKKTIISSIIVLILLIVVGIVVFINFKGIKKDYEIEKIESWEYFTLYKDGKYGIIDKNGNIVIEPKYESVKIPNPTKTVFFCEKDNEQAILNNNAEVIFSQFDEVSDIKLEELAIDVPYEKSVLKYKENGKYGIVSFDEKKITKPIYDSIESLSYKEGELLVQKDGKYGVINILGNDIIDNKYDEIKIDSYYNEKDYYRNSGYIVGMQSDQGIKYSYITYKYNKLNLENCESIERITDIEDKDEIYLIYKKDGKYGIQKNNSEILKNEYDLIEYDKLNNLFIIQKDGKYGVYDIEGKEIIENLYDSVKIEGNYIYAQNGEDEIKFDKTGNKIENEDYISSYPTENKDFTIVINQENKYGVMDFNENIIISEDYYYIQYLENNYFAVSNIDGKNGIIDSKGREILETKYDTIQKIENSSVIQVYDNTDNVLFLYNSDMNKICELEDGKIYVNNEYIRAYSDNKIQYFTLDGIEKNSKDLLPKNNLFADVKNGKWGFIDANGNVKIPYNYDEVTELNEYGFAGIKKDDKWGSIDKDGNIIIEPTYEISIDNSELSFIGKYYKIIYGYKKFYYTDNIL